MDEINNGFNPTDEYAPIEQEIKIEPISNEESTVENGFDDTQTVENTQTDESATETVDATEDVFEAFEKAQQEAAPAFTPQNTYPHQQNVPQYNAQYPQYGQQAPQPTAPYPAQYPQRPYNGNFQQPVNNVPQYNAQYPQHPNYVPPSPPQTPPYQPNGNFNPYTAQPQAPTPTQKQKTPTKTKVLIGVLIGLLVVFMLAFFVSCSAAVFGSGQNSFANDNPLAGYATEPDYDYYYGDDFGFDPYSPYYDFNSYDGSTFTQDITLQADEGETQEKDGDKKNNTYEPDEDAKGIEFEKLPKDKDSKKYTTNSAYNEVTDCVVSVVCYEDKVTDNEEDIMGEGTGTIVSSDGYIVTNSHVIGDSKAYTINIILNNSDEYIAKVVGYDTRTDLAVLKIDAKNLSYVKFSDSSDVEVGQDIVAIGNPGGTSFQNSLTKGIVSAVDRELMLNANVKYIQIDAAINPGNSGGPLCNLYGQVIGINTAKISSEEYEGMGFAVPSNIVAEVANDLIKYGYVKDRVRLGLLGREVDYEMTYTYGVPYGVLITQIDEDGPLANTDVQELDIITAIDGQEISTFQEIFAILEEHKAGDEVELTLYRLES